MRRQIADSFRSIANLIDPPQAMAIVLRLDGRAIAHTVNQHALQHAKPMPHGWLDRIIGRIFGW